MMNERDIHQSINRAYTCIILCLSVSPFRKMDDGTRPPKTSPMSCTCILQYVPNSLCKPNGIYNIVLSHINLNGFKVIRIIHVNK